MKKLLALAVVLCAAGPASAQLFSPESFTGAALGAITGAIVGGHHSGEGAAIGAGVGWFLGTLAHEDRVARGYYYHGGYYPPYYYYQPNYVASAYNVPAYTVSTTPAVQNQAPPPPASAPSPSPAINNPPTPSANPMSAANALFGR